MEFCHWDSMLPVPDGTFDETDRKIFLGLVVPGNASSQTTTNANGRLSWMAFCGGEWMSLHPDGSMSSTDRRVGLGLRELTAGRSLLTLLGVS